MHLLRSLRRLEKALSDVRKSQKESRLPPIETLEELVLIEQAKREHLPIIALLSGKALINLDHESFYLALEAGTIDLLVEDTPLLRPFLKEATATFRLSDEARLSITSMELEDER